MFWYPEKYKPNVAYIPTDQDIHQDHRATFEACKVALRFVDKILCYEIVNSSSFSPNVFLKSKKYRDKKLAAIKIYGDEIRKFPYPRSLEGVDVLHKYRGMGVYEECVEAFELIKDVID